MCAAHSRQKPFIVFQSSDKFCIKIMLYSCSLFVYLFKVTSYTTARKCADTAVYCGSLWRVRVILLVYATSYTITACTSTASALHSKGTTDGCCTTHICNFVNAAFPILIFLQDYDWQATLQNEYLLPIVLMTLSTFLTLAISLVRST